MSHRLHMLWAMCLLLALGTSGTLQAQDPLPQPLEGYPQSRLELVQRAFEAIQAQDVEAYLALFLGYESSVLHCPGLYEGLDDAALRERAYSEQLVLRRARIEHRMKECHDLIDFSSAEVLWAEGGGWDDPISVCTLDVAQLDDLELYLRIGDQMFEVEIDDPASLRGDVSFFVTDEPRCRNSVRKMDRYLRQENGIDPATPSDEGTSE